MSLTSEAVVALDRGQKDDALMLLSTASKKAPGSCMALGELAVGYQRAGDLKEAERLYLKALKSPRDASTFDVMQCLAGLWQSQGKHLSAACLFKQARRMAGTPAEAQAAAQAAINCSLEAGDHPGAIEELIFLHRQPGSDARKIQGALDQLYATEYHKWYYNSRTWEKLSYRGVPAAKSPADMWSYQEILSLLRPGLVIEFGTLFGGATLFFADLLKNLCPRFKVLSVDVDHARVHKVVREDANIELMNCSSTSQKVHQRIGALREEFPGHAFAILDSDHSQDHVFAELELLRDLLRAGDYVVVEDSNVNGHPVRPDFGPGPYEAIVAYLKKYPDDYARDEQREEKFGFTFATGGFLVRK